MIGNKRFMNFFQLSVTFGPPCTKQIYGAGIPPKETKITAKKRPNLLVEVKAKVYYGFKMMARKFFKYGQVKRTLMH